MKTIKYSDLQRHCAGTFLCDDLPDNWKEMSAKDQDEFLA